MVAASKDQISTIFDVLRHPFRRYILLRLYSRDGATEISLDSRNFMPKDTDREQFRRELSHIHLPKLADTGFIDWDRHQNTIRRGPRFEGLHPFLDLLTKGTF